MTGEFNCNNVLIVLLTEVEVVEYKSLQLLKPCSCFKSFDDISHPTGWKEGNVVFNDALNTLYLWLYG